MLDIVILAAGKGTRMRSKTPKVMHLLGGKPFVQHVVDRSTELLAENLHIVVGHGAEQVQTHFDGQAINFVEQKEQLGTGHAVQQALPHIGNDSVVLILYGDVPLISTATLSKLVEQVSEQAMALLTVRLDQPQGYGRIVRDANNQVVAIVEQKDANEDQLKIQEVNTGVMALHAKHLHAWLPELKNNNAQGEYYLTDVVALANSKGIAVNSAFAASEFEVLGVNNRMQQAELERRYQQDLAYKLLEQGVSLRDPHRIDCRGKIEHGDDCVIDVNCVFEGEVTLGDDVYIGPNCIIINSEIGSGTVIQANSIIEDSVVKRSCNIGPYARLRPGSELENGAKIGNFVELKKAKIGEGSKVNHLSYVGDAQLGKGVNVGAGTITCNYDGANKYKTEIKDNVFVGSNTALVAPLTIEEGATIAAGSTITKAVDKQQLALARQRQTNIDGWKRPVKTK